MDGIMVISHCIEHFQRAQQCLNAQVPPAISFGASGSSIPIGLLGIKTCPSDMCCNCSVIIYIYYTYLIKTILDHFSERFF